DFLRHIERTRVLVHVLDGNSPDPLGDLEAINQELTLFNPALADKPQIVAFNKMDLPDAQARWPEVEEAVTRLGLPVLAISAVTRDNVEQLLYRTQAMLDELPALDLLPEDEALPEITPADDEKLFFVVQEGDSWRVEGIAVERAAQMTNWDYYEAAMRFQRILDAMGISDALRSAGVQDGDTVRIGDAELVWGYSNAFGE
ncbi:MAG: Obg family GTPase CgtA, partial [Caldilineaceae bacterium]|nr:Obg family GTPase CgtA [Caldilineaceae bacterium]